MTRAPLDLDRLRARLPDLDGRPLVVLGYPHRDIGFVIREHLARIDAAPEGINPDFYLDRLSEIKAALEGQA